LLLLHSLVQVLRAICDGGSIEPRNGKCRLRQSPAPEIAGSAKATPAVIRKAVARRFVMLVGNHEAGIEAGAGAPLRGEKERQTNPAMRRNE
jgi:hypothetical protein